jgi:HSP20 family molecular chaperone IbpA
LEKLTDVKLAKRKFILGLRRNVLHVVFENVSREKIFQVFFAVNDPKEWKERIWKAANFVTENVHAQLTDIFEEKDCIKVLTKLPDNVDGKGLMITASEDTLTINGNASNGRYHRTIELPASVRKGTVKATCKGKILEVNMEKLQTWRENGRI